MSNATLDRLEGLIFRVNIPDGRSECYGTGFFISRDYALTAFHNLSNSVLEDPEVPVEAVFHGRTIQFRQALPGDHDRAWQEQYDVAVLKAASPIDVSILRLLYLNEDVKGRERRDVWRDRSVTAVGIPAGKNGPEAVRGRTPNDWPLCEARRTISGEDHGAVPETLRFGPGDDRSLEAPWGLSGSPVFDEEMEGIVGVLVAAKTEFHATELAHVVNHWPDGKPFFEDIDSLSNARRRQSAWRRRWLLPASLGTLAVATVLALLAWLRPGTQPPEKLFVELERPGTGTVEVVKDQITANEGEKLRLLMRSPVDGYLYVVDREFTHDGTQRTPYLAYPTLTSGVGENHINRGNLLQFPDQHDSPPTIIAKPSKDGDADYAGEQLTVLVYDSELVPPDRLRADPIPLTPQEFPVDGGRLLFSSTSPLPKISKTIRLVVSRRR